MRLALESFISLLHNVNDATLATHSQQLPGYPYASAVPFVPDSEHRPMILVSALAEHTKNLLSDGRVSLSLVDHVGGDVQAAARATMLGEVESFQPGGLLLSRYLRYQPEASAYLALDFMFFRICPKRVRYIEGVGKMGWMTAEDMQSACLLPIEDEQRLVDAVQPLAPAGMYILGIDGYGVDYRRDGVRGRCSFDLPSGLECIDVARVLPLIQSLA